MSMYTEVVAIISCRVLYLSFREHRFVFNFAYGFDTNDENMANLALLVCSTFLELAFEVIVDAFALNNEWHVSAEPSDMGS